MIEATKNFVLENWRELRLGPQPPRRITTLFVSGTPGVQGKAVILFFADRSPKPFLVAKAARDKRYTAYLSNEYYNLNELRRSKANQLHQNMPEPVFGLGLGCRQKCP